MNEVFVVNLGGTLVKSEDGLSKEEGGRLGGRRLR